MRAMSGGEVGSEICRGDPGEILIPFRREGVAVGLGEGVVRIIVGLDKIYVLDNLAAECVRACQERKRECREGWGKRERSTLDIRVCPRFAPGCDLIVGLVSCDAKQNPGLVFFQDEGCDDTAALLYKARRAEDDDAYETTALYPRFVLFRNCGGRLFLSF